VQLAPHNQGRYNGLVVFHRKVK